MRKLLPFVVCGLAAVSYSALAADDKTEIDANTKIQGDAKAGSANPGARAGGTTSTDVGTDAKAGAGVAGAGADAKAGVGARGDVTDAPSVNTQDREQAKGKAAVTPKKDAAGAGTTAKPAKKEPSAGAGSSSSTTESTTTKESNLPAPAEAPAPKKAD